ncbi:Uncharacterized protein BM_BM13188 [Brugia malayi]|uniref:Bm13188 n=1 Tax=Brugia malayi TaxID=6279 RepID=A0A0J9Y329_BRUMA|nr:Uncharacterized protein BM_BM13188 [Brugia malayi]CDQ01366.1 Bm13188 [Brugia malayi]VIO90108.1 Uncharacterized protein BM_BM13188 [Brugia malayi]
MKVTEEDEKLSHRLRRTGPKDSFTIEVPLEAFVQEQQMKLVRIENNKYLESNKQQTSSYNNNNNNSNNDNNNVENESNDNNNINDRMNHQSLVMNQ